MASHIKVSPPAGAVTVGNSSEFHITVPAEAGTGPLNVSVKAQLTPKPLDVKDNGNQTMTVSFTPRANGKHEFTLTWAEVAVAGSPFSIDVTGEPARDASKVKTDGVPTSAKAGEKIKFKVSAADEAGPGPLLLDAEGPAEPSIELMNTSGGNFEVEVNFPSAGEYKLELFWGEGNAIPGSPFTIKAE
jgi:filamin